MEHVEQDAVDIKEQGGPSSTLPSLEMLQTMITAAVEAAMRASEDPDPLPDDGEEDDKGRFVQGTDFLDVLARIRDNLEFSAPVMASTEEDFLAQYHCPEAESFPLHSSVKTVLTNEWKHLESQSFPRFLLKRYPLEGFSEEFPSNVKVDNLVGGLSTQGSVVSENALSLLPCGQENLDCCETVLCCF
ncbi:hypothetical protein NDU88_005720 [Pleurodeles waltl]|uniref:Uncharacterized protein n=1 Tax=Pleurodeles waltl TaxID=8319 RepID=A0AAV7LM06_PLEWA|nr:hypothetical protein NDU88_005720 [Pleurodeles waltl]